MKHNTETYRGLTLKYVDTQTFGLVVSIYDKTHMMNRIPWNMTKDEARKNAIHWINRRREWEKTEKGKEMKRAEKFVKESLHRK